MCQTWHLKKLRPPPHGGFMGRHSPDNEGSTIVYKVWIPMSLQGSHSNPQCWWMAVSTQVLESLLGELSEHGQNQCCLPVKIKLSSLVPKLSSHASGNNLIHQGSKSTCFRRLCTCILHLSVKICSLNIAQSS